MSTREELVKAVERSRGIFDVAWDAYMDAACDIRSVFWAQAYAAWDVLNDACAALKAYDTEQHMRELLAEGVDTCFLNGKNSLINAACTYPEGSLAEHWWTRGFAYSELERVVSSNAETECGQREWVGLNAKDLSEIPPSCFEGAIWAEAKLKEKNT